MDQKNLESFRELLNGQLAELRGNVHETVSEMTDETALFADPTDRALLESNRNFTLRMRDRERKLIDKIEEALERIDDGTFGVCEECGEDIPVARMKARPVTTFCVDCKSKAEVLEKKKKG